MATKLILTCEHATNHIPKEYEYYFKPERKIKGQWIGKIAIKDLLEDHWGWDPGAFEMAKRMQKKLNAKFFDFKVSRLLIDANHSDWNENLFSEISSNFDEEAKQKLLNKYYYPYLNSIEKYMLDEVKKGNKVLHVDVHAFTPVYNGIVRKVDIGLLIQDDKKERELGEKIKKVLESSIRGIRVRFNQPYLGEGDCIPTAFKYQFSRSNYLGIAIEVNNKFFRKNKKKFNKICNSLIKAIEGILKDKKDL